VENRTFTCLKCGAEFTFEEIAASEAQCCEGWSLPLNDHKETDDS
jgi:hypothetical protein